MTARADVVPFPAPPKRCVHGQPMERKQRFRGPVYWEATDCAECRAEEQARMDAADTEVDAMCERIKARRQRP